MTPGVQIFTAETALAAPAAFAVANGTVLSTGEVDELRQRFPTAEITDFGSGVLIPGLIDAHTHLGMTAENLLHLDLSASATPTRDSLLAALRAEAERLHGRPGWVRGSRYDDVKTGTITRWDLDAAVPDRPAFVHHVAAHWGVLNSRGLEVLGITDPDSAPVGGSYGVDEHGELDGKLYERALMNVMGSATGVGEVSIPEASLTQRLEGVARGNRMFHAAGLTAVCDALASPEDIELYQAARADGRLTLRMGMLLSINHYDKMRDLRTKSGFGDDFLRIVGVKTFVDGAIGGRTCLLGEPFADSDYHGLQTTPTDTLNEQVEQVHADGNRVGIHANGDEAIRIALAAIERAQKKYPRPALRHRIEHCSLIDDAILEKLKELDVVAVPFAGYPAYHGGALNRWYGTERAGRMFAHRSFLDAGIPVAGSSDYPCGPFEPLVGIQSMVTRTGLDDGEVVGPGQRISVTEALRIFTRGSASACGAADRLGSLAPGYAADFVVLDRDISAVAPDEISRAVVQATFVSGVQVY
jgi:predicted amidohydrolase YtcJ